MARKYLTMEINYDVEKDKFDIKGDITLDGQVEILDSFIRSHVFGAGHDPTPMIERDQYQIRLQWFPDNDEIRSEYDTGNKGLRDGILIEYLKRLQK